MPSLHLRPFVALALLLCAPALAAGPIFLTGPQVGEPLELALGYLQAHGADYGLGAGDLAELEVTDHYRTEHNGVTHVYLRQRHQGIPVFNGVINLNVASDGSIVNLGNRAVSGLASRVDTVAPTIAAEDAILATAAHFGIAATEAPRHLETLGGPTLEARFAPSGISRDEIPVSLMYQPTDDGAVRLAWRTVIRHPTTSDWWDVRVDATTGAILDQTNWTSHVAESGNCYNAIPLPAADPNDTGMATVLACAPYDLTASPFGWHDEDGVAGAEYTDTRGNNVWAQEDLDNNNSGGIRPDGGAILDFLPIWDPSMDPASEGPPHNNLHASIVNLFYYNNVMHDVTYQYGFDEASGNFQANNYGNGGLGNDPVNADALDGSGTNNANFGTPPDGSRPRMQMYRWTNPFGQLVTVNSPVVIQGDYLANPSNNGGTANGLTADLEIVDDGVAPADDGCEMIQNDLTGKIALMLWSQGLCNSSVFVQNAANAGAIAAIIIDETDEPRTNFGGSASIPSVAVGLANGTLFMDTIGNGDTINATIDDNPAGTVDRDSDLDNGIIGHEYGHGISNRLTGGPSTTGCLSNQEQAGEGWSDFWTVLLSPQASDRPSTTRGVGTYVGFEGRDGLGIRNFPYSTDMTVNPQTYADIGSTNLPHGLGEIWMSMLWELHWELVARYGLDPDLYTGTGGNNLLIQLVVDGMKLQPCSPSIVDARDAILLADQTNNAGANQCEIWRAFAKRGVGENANAGSAFVVGDETEDFTLPAACAGTLPNYVFDDGFESGDTGRWSAASP